MHRLLTPAVWLGSSGDGMSVLNVSHVRSRNSSEDEFSDVSSPSLHCSMLWEMFYVVKRPVYSLLSL